MSIVDILKYVCYELEKREIEYMLSGSMALTTYVEPRFTRDIDIIVDLKDEDISSFLSIFNDDYYLNKTTVLKEVKGKGMFNVISNRSGYKIDFVLKKNTDFRNKEFERKKHTSVFDFKVWMVSPEDLLLSKLIWIQEIKSDNQLMDIKSLWELANLDRAYIKEWIVQLKLKTYNLFDA